MTQLFGSINFNDTIVKRPNPPSFTDLLNDVLNHAGAYLNCHNIGKIVSFDKDTQTASVELLIKKLVGEDLNGNKSYIKNSILVDVPCVVICGGSGRLEMPISSGDECLVLFNDRQIDNWFVSGDSSTIDIKRSHDLSDGIALVGIKSKRNSFTDYITDGVRLVYDFAVVQLKAIETYIHNTVLVRINAPLITLEGNVTMLGGLGGTLSSTFVSRNELATNFIQSQASSLYNMESGDVFHIKAGTYNEVESPITNFVGDELLFNGHPILTSFEVVNGIPYYGGLPVGLEKIDGGANVNYDSTTPIFDGGFESIPDGYIFDGGLMID